MSEKDLELEIEQTDSAEENVELKEKATQKFSGEKEYKKSELDDELERLAQTFREEFKKAREEHGDEFFEDDEGVIADEDLCECCGEARKSKEYGDGYPYCEDCREAMKRYPFSWSNIVVAVAMLVLSVVSAATFFGDFDGYYHTYLAKDAASERKMTTAINNYDTAISFFDGEDIDAKKVKLDCADAVYETMNEGISSMNRIEDLISSALTEFDVKLPVYQSYVDLRNEAMVLYGTMQKFYLVVNDSQYSDFEDPEIYEEAMTAIGKILDEEIQVESMYGNEIMSFPADESIIRFCQFMYAYTAGNHEDSYQYMRKVEELKPDYLWLYAYELGIVDAQTGDAEHAKELADAMYANDKENYGSYCVYSCAERLSGKYDSAIKWADKGIENVPDNTEILRHKAMALCMKGEFEQAKESLEIAGGLEQNGLIGITLLVVENELGNKEAIEEIKTYLEENEVEIPQRTQDYLGGKITVEQLFGEGTGDIE